MVKYRITINRNLCIDCGLATGRCPTHAIEISRILRGNGVFSEDFYDCVKTYVNACPVKAISIEEIEE